MLIKDNRIRMIVFNVLWFVLIAEEKCDAQFNIRVLENKKTGEDTRKLQIKKSWNISIRTCGGLILKEFTIQLGLPTLEQPMTQHQTTANIMQKLFGIKFDSIERILSFVHAL